MAASNLVQNLIDNINGSEESKNNDVAKLINNTCFNLETQINLKEYKRILILGYDLSLHF